MGRGTRGVFFTTIFGMYPEYSCKKSSLITTVLTSVKNHNTPHASRPTPQNLAVSNCHIKVISRYAEGLLIIIYMKYLLSLVLLCAVQAAIAQTTLNGILYDEQNQPLVGAAILWENTKIGTASDENGAFSLPKIDTLNIYHLEINYIGFEPILIPIEPKQTEIITVIEGISELEEVTITAKERNTSTSTLNRFNIEEIGDGELRRAPCCNLAESFETNAAVDVSYTDAVTGAKEIELLGLRGIYTQMMLENRPALYGLATAYGMEYIPGTWLQSIQISKGASTVVNGGRSIVGQINTELQKPDKMPLLFVNLFGDMRGRGEVNVQSGIKVSRGVSTGIFVHASAYQNELDHNHDGFLDQPKKRQLNVLNRWQFDAKNIESQLSIQALIDEREGGEYPNHATNHGTDLYKINVNARRAEAVWKIGYLGFKKPYQSMGFQSVATFHDHKSNFGSRIYNGQQRSLYTNLIYESIIVNTFHKIRTGASYQLDDYRETFEGTALNTRQSVPGVFFEYTWELFRPHDHDHEGEHDHSTEHHSEIPTFVLTAGLRADYLNQFNRVIPVPRLNLKYNFNTRSVVRLSAGRGWRIANPYAENIGLMPSNRIFVMANNLQPEVAWNYGINYTKKFLLFETEGSVNVDVYRTDFENQIVVNLEDSDQLASFTNLAGKSFANVGILTWTQEWFKGFEMRLAYKLTDTRTTFADNRLEQKTLLPLHRGLLNLNYQTPNKAWKFNTTLQVSGTQRLPDYNGITNRQAPAFATLNAQVTKVFPKLGLEIYVGGENLTNYRQNQPILSPENAGNVLGQGQSPFDATQVYAPIMGAMAYAGLRYTMPKDLGQKVSVIQTSARCGMCKEIIEAAVLALPGVKTAKLDLHTKQLSVTFNSRKVTLAQVQQAVAASGYDADDVKRNMNAYDALSPCCKDK